MLKRAFSVCLTGRHSRSCVVLGSQWGDEGKGKLVDILAQDYDIVGRFNGGANAGHTIEAQGIKFGFHLLPCGVLYEQTKNVIGNGVVVNIPSMFEEIKQLSDNGISIDGKLFVSNRAHIVTNAQIQADGSYEQQLSSQQIGTTKKGIGPTYSSKTMRIGLRMTDLTDWEFFTEKYNHLVDFLERAFPIQVNRQEELDQFLHYRERILPMITDTAYLISQEISNGKKLLAEGANALMLDLDYGTYPYVTSSSTGIAGVFSGLGFPPSKLETTVGVMKAYTTRVGSGPFPTEDTGEVGNHLQTKGREVGVTTGRKRRCGWLDLMVMKYSHMLNDYTSLNITKLDILDELETIKVGVGYELDGSPLYTMPASLKELGRVKVVYKELKGWQSDITSCVAWDQLPQNAKTYVEFIEDELKLPITWIGTGPKRENVILNPKYS